MNKVIIKEISEYIKPVIPAKLRSFLRYGPYRIIYYCTHLIMKKNVKCVCCGKQQVSFSNFTPFARRFNLDRYHFDNCHNIICKYCGSLPRHRIACTYFEKNSYLATDKILIIAAEESIKTWFKRNNISFITADLYEYADIKMDIQNIECSDNVYTLIVCNHVLEHVCDYKLALKELYRIIKTGGILEITVPIDIRLSDTYEDASIKSVKGRIEKFGQCDHLRIFGKNFSTYLLEIGFSVEIIDGNLLPPKIRPIIGPADYDYNKVFICKK